MTRKKTWERKKIVTLREQGIWDEKGKVLESIGGGKELLNGNVWHLLGERKM